MYFYFLTAPIPHKDRRSNRQDTGRHELRYDHQTDVRVGSVDVEAVAIR